VDHNRVHLIGRLTKDPEFFPEGRKGEVHCSFTLAINRVVPNEQGPQADYIPCSLWGEEARRFVETRSKGDTVGILGRVRTSYVPQANGSSKFFWEVRVDEVQYGQRSLKNLRPRPTETHATSAMKRLTTEFERE
jgi:single-strand DNA-binding protein